MHPLTRVFNHLKRKDFSAALVREHIGSRDLTEWYPDWIYEAMETDEVRNQAYHDTILETVAGKIVLELGTGRKALWAIRCAEAGARKVYAIEANRKAYESSCAVLQSRGIDNVHLICGFSDRVELPERCEVLVHDLVGDIGSSEGMIPFIDDARRRFLTPDAIHIPHRCATHVVLVEDPHLHWSEWLLSYALRGFQPFETLSFVRFFGFPPAAALSQPHAFEDIRFAEPPSLRTENSLRIEIQRDGTLRGILFFIRLHFGEQRLVDTWASQTTWATPYIRFRSATPVRQGDTIELSVQTDLSASPKYAVKAAHRKQGALTEIGAYEWVGD